jgi:hypothetical protein
MTPICQAHTKDAPHAYQPRTAHPCKNAVWADGWCKVHHPTLRLARLHRKRATLEKSLQKVRAEIHSVEEEGASAHDTPGQLRMFTTEQATA